MYDQFLNWQFATMLHLSNSFPNTKQMNDFFVENLFEENMRKNKDVEMNS